MVIKINLMEILLFFVLLLSIFPLIVLGGFGMPVLYLFIPISFYVFLFIILGKLKVPAIVKPIFLWFLFIIFEIFISTIIGTATAFNQIMFPTDIIQYVARFLCIITFIALFYNSKLEAESFIKKFLIVLNVAMSIGILQWFSWGGQAFFIQLYPFGQGQENFSHLDLELYLRRIHGFAQHATSNGGIAAFAFIYAYSIFTYFKKHKTLSIVLMLMSIVNIFASQARAGMLALAFALFAFYFLSVCINRNAFKSTITLVVSTITSVLAGYILLNAGNSVIEQAVYRWSNLINAGGGGRIDQIDFALSLLTEPHHYLVGISRAFQSHSGLTFLIEMEPVNIFILYGSIGFILQYSLVGFLLLSFLKNILRKDISRESLSLLVASFVGLASYQVFSVAYFFFREIHVGLIPWILMGVAIGIFERQKRNSVIKLPSIGESNF